MAPSQTRMLTAENSRLGKVPDLVVMLQNENAWKTIPRETREHLYTQLPPANESESPRDPDVNPLLIERLKPYIEEELRRWQDDLREGRETKKWRAEAAQAGKDHSDGKFNEWKLIAREEYWDKPTGDAVATSQEVKDGEGEGTKEGMKVNGDEKAVEESEDGNERKPDAKINGVSETKEASDGEKEIKDSDEESEL